MRLLVQVLPCVCELGLVGKDGSWLPGDPERAFIELEPQLAWRWSSSRGTAWLPGLERRIRSVQKQAGQQTSWEAFGKGQGAEPSPSAHPIATGTGITPPGTGVRAAEQGLPGNRVL